MRLSFLSDQKHQITVRNDGANGETTACGMNYLFYCSEARGECGARGGRGGAEGSEGAPHVL